MMKKYLLLLAGLMLALPYGEADAKAVKLGRGKSSAYNMGANLNTGGGTQIDTSKKCDSSCSTCDTATGKCTGCPSGKRPLDSKCVDYCYGVECNTGYTTTVTSNGCCCENDAMLCQSGYSYNETYQGCIKDTTNCMFGCYYLGCGIGSTLKPDTGYYIKADGTCPACSTAIANCAECSLAKLGATPTCTKCNDGYTLSNGACIACPANCTTCSDSSTCSACDSGYTLVNKKCYAPNVCSSIPDYDCYTVDPDRYVGWAGEIGVELCAEILENYGTMENFAPNDPSEAVYANGNCAITCPANCTTCSDSSTCTKCNDGYVLSNGSCTSYDEYCKSYSDSFYWAACPTGMTQTGGGPANCKSCSACSGLITIDNGTCTACSSTTACTAVNCNDGYTQCGMSCCKKALVCAAGEIPICSGTSCVSCTSGQHYITAVGQCSGRCTTVGTTPAGYGCSTSYDCATAWCIPAYIYTNTTGKQPVSTGTSGSVCGTIGSNYAF